jgi:hypothetical protein
MQQLKQQHLCCVHVHYPAVEPGQHLVHMLRLLHGCTAALCPCAAVTVKADAHAFWEAEFCIALQNALLSNM